jgi:ATP-binding cassette subfamily F protein uup
MSFITVKDLELRYHQKIIFSGINFVIPKNKKIGLVGINGSGKSSLMKIVAGKSEYDEGEILYSNNLFKYYLAQELNYKPQTILEYLTDTNLKPDDQELYFLRLNDNRKYFSIPQDSRLVTDLSGGQQRQVSLLKAFSMEPDLLLLDEPTNHLDVISLLSLQELFKNYPKTILFISHDRYFLDQTVDEIWELEKGKLYKHPGSYTHFINEKDRRRQDQQIRYDKNKQELVREHEWFIAGVKARSTKDQGRMTRYYELKAWVEKNKPKWQKPFLPVPTPNSLGNKILKLVKLFVRLPDSDKYVIKNLDYDFDEKVRLGLLGPNGSGKTTLLRAILDLYPHEKGKIIIGQNTEFNYQDQKRLELKDDKTVHQSISEGNIEMVFGKIKTNVFAYMKKFLFFKEDLDQAVFSLSGGQRARLLLAKILKQGGNFLILDEPTNDLDVDTMEALENTLRDFPGPILIVSHDRYFLDKVCSQVLALEGEGEFTISTGGYSDYINKYGSEKDFWHGKSQAGIDKKQQEQEKAEEIRQPDQIRQKYKSKELRKIKTKMREMEKEIEKLDEQIKAKQIEVSFGSFYTQKPEKIQKELDKLKNMQTKKEELETGWLEIGEGV